MQTVALVIEMNAGLDAATIQLEVHGLWAGYGARDVLEDYDLVVSRGEAVRLTGRNGSGKSTLLSCIAGSHKPRAGSIMVGGISLIDRPVEAKRLIGFSNANNSPARSPSPSSANAITVHKAACVYCPPFSRTPGT